MKQAISSELLTILNHLVGKNSIIQKIIEVPLQPDEPEIFIAFATFLNPILFRPEKKDPQRYPNISSAAGFTRENCLWAVVGEACERYAGAIYHYGDLIFDSYRNVEGQAINIEPFILFSHEQYQQEGFPYVKFNPDIKRNWARGRSLMNGNEVMIPAQMLWIGFDYMTADEMLDSVFSTGLAAGRSRIHAIFGGICEVIERDAFMTTWMLKRKVPQINLFKIKENLVEPLRGIFEIEGLDLNVRLLSNDINIPTVAAIVKPKDRDVIALGASCHPNPVKAAEKAVLEAFHTKNWTMDLERKGKSIPSIDSINDFEDHVKFYLDPEHFHYVKFMYEDHETDFEDEGTLTENYTILTRSILNELAAAGYEAYYVDMTTPDLDDVGMHVVKVIIPGLQPLDAAHRFRHLDDRRLKKVAAYFHHPYNGTIYSAPHPFP